MSKSLHSSEASMADSDTKNTHVYIAEIQTLLGVSTSQQPDQSTSQLVPLDGENKARNSGFLE